VKPLFDLASVRKTLQHGIDQGYWTLKQLDRPPAGRLRPESYRNLLRESEDAVRVDVVSPRDFDESDYF
jgi:hypothetical protein